MKLFNAMKLPLMIFGLLYVGKWGYGPVLSNVNDWFAAAGLVLFVYLFLPQTYGLPDSVREEEKNAVRPISFKWYDNLKALVCWLDAFKQTYAVRPGLYHIGERYDVKAPLVVTSNYFLTLFLVVKNLRGMNVRLLVIDTEGINVWCAAGKGKFGNEEIMKQVNRYDKAVLTDEEKITLILPKFSLAGVNLDALRKEGIRTVIGPLYAKDLAQYLKNPPYKDRDGDVVDFDFKARVFTWLPGLIQSVGYSLAVVLVFAIVEMCFGVHTPWQIVPITAFIATAYPLAFPYIPGKRFAVKGLWLGLFMAAPIAAFAATGCVSPWGMVSASLFTFAMSVFFALSYTGNSAVSNYSRVRAEIARFLPLDVLLYVGSLAAFIIKEVGR